MSRIPPHFPFNLENFPLFDVENCDEGWGRLSVETLYDGPHLHLEQTRYRTPARRDGAVDWTVLRRKAAVVVAPRLSDGRFLLVRQERYPVQRALWEFPAGQVDQGGGPPQRQRIIATVHSELREETGHFLPEEHSSLHPLGYYFSSQGYTDEHAYLFLATGVEEDPALHGQPLGEGGESILAVKPFSAMELQAMIANNEIRDANTLALYGRLCALGMTA